MSYRVEVESKAAKQLAALQPIVRERILDVIEELETNPRPNGCSKLKGQAQPAWRIRVGDYRVLYRIHDNQHIVRVYGILRRDEAYR